MLQHQVLSLSSRTNRRQSLACDTCLHSRKSRRKILQASVRQRLRNNVVVSELVPTCCRYRSRVRTCTLGTSTTPQNQRNAMQTVQINWSDPSAHHRVYVCLAQQAARSLSKANCKLTPSSISDSSSPLLQVGLSTLHHPAGRGLSLSCSSVINLLSKCSAYSDCS